MEGFVRNRGGVKQPNGSYRGGHWTAYWEEEPTAGKRRQGSKGGFTTKRAAQEHLTAVLGAKQSGEYVPPAKTSFGRYLVESWLPLQEPRLGVNFR